jgi:hypothetical protein
LLLLLLLLIVDEDDVALRFFFFFFFFDVGFLTGNTVIGNVFKTNDNVRDVWRRIS